MAPGTFSQFSLQNGEKHGVEKRASPRRPANDLSQILFDNCSLGCLIHNISETGAMIEVSTSRVPDRFILINHRMKNRMICQVIWRDNMRIGVRFATLPKTFSDGFGEAE